MSSLKENLKNSKDRWNFQFATKQDLKAISSLVNSAYRGDSSRQGWTTEADLLDGQRTDPEILREALEQKDYFLLCMYESQQLVGCVMLQKKSQLQQCYLGMLTVAPQLQNQGLGKILLAQSEHQARLWGCTDMVLSVIPLRKELVQWYERHGYQFTGTTEDFPYNDERFGRPRRNDLCLAQMKKKLKENKED